MTINRIHSSFIRKHPDLLDEYATECSLPVIGKPDPQWDTYDALEKAGLMLCLGVYEGSTLVGFASLIMNILPHYGVKTGVVESLFVSKNAQARTYATWNALKSRLIGEATVEDCDVVLFSAPVGGSLDRLMQLDGIPSTNRVYPVKL